MKNNQSVQNYTGEGSIEGSKEGKEERRKEGRKEGRKKGRKEDKKKEENGTSSNPVRTQKVRKVKAMARVKDLHGLRFRCFLLWSMNFRG